ncbi:MAG: hypothetical protein H8E48_12775, partial [Chloroflexi bacterium]|nr:hypothetical protein [Chloroflexota bacterium]
MTLFDETPDGGSDTATPETPVGSSMQSLEQIALLVRNCTDCPLSGSRTNSVPGEGNPQASAMSIRDLPGYDEDLHVRAFVGRAGKLPFRLVASLNLIGEDLVTSHLVKRRPPCNRDPPNAWRAA